MSQDLEHKQLQEERLAYKHKRNTKQESENHSKQLHDWVSDQIPAYLPSKKPPSPVISQGDETLVRMMQLANEWWHLMNDNSTIIIMVSHIMGTNKLETVRSYPQWVDETESWSIWIRVHQKMNHQTAGTHTVEVDIGMMVNMTKEEMHNIDHS
ncbi:hypothetical protein BDN71DRAFT_1429193 [Pleurotus eryngii]|uniref:Uncharacterized protein n=1 Tax=Pleurotus eryngii TaxID=5323 RepID=A0A9P6A5T7_PLEER|nr:hypothetical protein BDN71DRAFT_1429193 [Pleurotus eryngii]